MTEEYYTICTKLSLSSLAWCQTLLPTTLTTLGRRNEQLESLQEILRVRWRASRGAPPGVPSAPVAGAAPAAVGTVAPAGAPFAAAVAVSAAPPAALPAAAPAVASDLGPAAAQVDAGGIDGPPSPLPCPDLVDLAAGMYVHAEDRRKACVERLAVFSGVFTPQTTFVHGFARTLFVSVATD